jgi:hypothetical protein
VAKGRHGKCSSRPLTKRLKASLDSAIWSSVSYRRRRRRRLRADAGRRPRSPAAACSRGAGVTPAAACSTGAVDPPAVPAGQGSAAAAFSVRRLCHTPAGHERSDESSRTGETAQGKGRNENKTKFSPLCLVLFPFWSLAVLYSLFFKKKLKLIYKTPYEKSLPFICDCQATVLQIES